MKKVKIIVFIFILTISASSWSEETKTGNGQNTENKEIPTQTLFNMKNANFSGYGAIEVKYSKIGKKNACLAGARGGLIIDDNFVLGVAGYGLTYPREREEISGETYIGNEPYLAFGYGGGLLEYYFSPKSLFHVSLGLVLGGGGVDFYAEKDDDYENDSTNDKFFAVEPSAHVWVNIAKFCRAGIGVSYRHTNGIDSDNFSDDDFSGVNGSVMVAFGWF